MAKTFYNIPKERPLTPLLDRVDYPKQLRYLSEAELILLADELREYLLYTVGQTGGHFGSGLGVVELTIALHYVFDTPDDHLIWDVGHQAYPHKILTGRRERMDSLRKQGGIAAFPKRTESEYDSFGVGHSSTSISAALGMAIASRLQGTNKKSVAVIGDGALTAGMAFEALNHATAVDADMLVVLNDNDMSISDNIGGLSNHLAKILSSKAYSNVRNNSKKLFSHLPGVWTIARLTEGYAKGIIAPTTLFEALGWNYIGPIDGHDIPTLVATLRNMRGLSGPQFLHVVTKKGKGFEPAEEAPTTYHAISKVANVNVSVDASKIESLKYANIFGQWLCDMASQDEKLIGITPAMKEGSDLVDFSERYPKRYFDVAIAEQHAVTLAAGMACEGLKPVVAIYSTFLQRAYDQLIHDVAIQHLDVLFAIDRAGLVGEDGPTHAGSFDLSYMRCIPGIIIMTPSDEDEMRKMLTTGYLHYGPAAVRYPRGTVKGVEMNTDLAPIEIGKAIIRRSGKTVAILVFGVQLSDAMIVAEKINATLIDMRFVKPLDENLLLDIASQYELFVTVEENSIIGGAGSGVAEFFAKEGIIKPCLHLGLPDEYIEHAAASIMQAECGLDAVGIELAINHKLKQLSVVV